MTLVAQYVQNPGVSVHSNCLPFSLSVGVNSANSNVSCLFLVQSTRLEVTLFGRVKTAKWASGSTKLERIFVDITICPVEGDEVGKVRVYNEGVKSKKLRKTRI